MLFRAYIKKGKSFSKKSKKGWGARKENTNL